MNIKGIGIHRATALNASEKQRGLAFYGQKYHMKRNAPQIALKIKNRAFKK